MSLILPLYEYMISQHVIKDSYINAGIYNPLIPHISTFCMRFQIKCEEFKLKYQKQTLELCIELLFKQTPCICIY